MIKSFSRTKMSIMPEHQEHSPEELSSHGKEAGLGSGEDEADWR